MTKDLQKIPAGWKKVKLGEVLNLKNGKSPNLIDSGDYVVYGSNGQIGFTNEYFLDGTFILIGRVGASGEISLISGKSWASDNCLIGECKSYTTPAFMYHLLTFLDLKKFITQTAQPLLTQSFLATISISFPPIHEQEKIAEILETVDNAIEKTDKFIEKYKRMKQGLMQELLTKGIDSNWQIRSEKTHKFKDSPLGRIPADWEVKNISEVIENLLNGTWGDEKDISDNCYPIIRSTEIDRYGRINLESADVRKVDKKLLDRFALKNFDILIVASSGSQDLIGRVALFKTNLDNNKFLFSNFMLRVRTTGTLKPIFLYYFLNSDRYKNFIQTFQETTTGLRNFPKKDFLKLTVSLPPLLEQERIASALSQVDAVIEKETAYRDKLSRIKQGLMEDLLTGKVRVTALLKNNQYQKEVL